MNTRLARGWMDLFSPETEEQGWRCRKCQLTFRTPHIHVCHGLVKDKHDYGDAQEWKEEKLFTTLNFAEVIDNAKFRTTLNFAACECLYESVKQSILFSPTYKTYRIYVLPSKSYVVVKAYFTGSESECPWRISLVEQFAHQGSYAGAKAVLASYAYGRRLPDYVR
jgi:hypothetical protein